MLIKTITFTFLIIHCLLFIANAQWVRMNGLSVNSIYSLTTSGNNILAGTYSNGIFLSSNNGNNWVQTSINTQTIWSLASDENNVFAGATSGNGVYRSTDAGITWNQTSLNNMTIYSVAVHGNNVFAGTADHGVFHSTNLGLNWIQTSLNNMTFTGLAIFGDTVFAGLGNNIPSIGGAYVSTNNGTNWALTYLDKECWSFAKISNDIFVGTNHGVYSSTNNGLNWVSINNGLVNYPSVSCLIVSGMNIIGGGVGIFLSKNNGVNWIYKYDGFTDTPYVTSLTISGNYIFAGVWGESVWRREISELTGVQIISSKLPEEYTLYQNYPNPFNPSTKIKFDVRAKGDKEFVTLKIYNVLGKEVSTLVNESLASGSYEVTWNGESINSGTYFYKIQIGNYIETKRMVLLK
jgi:hypothetical protein